MIDVTYKQDNQKSVRQFLQDWQDAITQEQAEVEEGFVDSLLVGATMMDEETGVKHKIVSVYQNKDGTLDIKLDNDFVIKSAAPVMDMVETPAENVVTAHFNYDWPEK